MTKKFLDDGREVLEMTPELRQEIWDIMLLAGDEPEHIGAAENIFNGLGFKHNAKGSAEFLESRVNADYFFALKIEGMMGRRLAERNCFLDHTHIHREAFAWWREKLKDSKE